MKLVPVTVSVVPDDPAGSVLGLSELMTGAATVSVEAADVAPPLGFLTVTLRFPALAIMLPGSVAVIEVAVPAVIVSAVLPTYATGPAVNVPSLVVPAMKLVPVTVRVVLDDPAGSVLGLSELMTGAATVSVEAADVAPPLEFFTVTPRLAALPSMLPGTVAVMEVAVPAVTVSAVLPT